MGKPGPRLVKGLATWSFHTIGFPVKECRSRKWDSIIPKVLRIMVEVLALSPSIHLARGQMEMVTIPLGIK